MLRRAGVWLVLIAGIVSMAGCATAPRRQESRWVEPAPVQQAPVQQGPSAEDVERLRRQNEEQQAALARAEAEKRELEDKLNDALASKKAPTQKTQDSYLK